MNEKTEKILIVDDEKVFLDTLSSFFSKKGFKVIKASNGSEGIRKSTREHPDLILLDIALPDVNGFDFLEEIRCRGIPTRVILFTGVYTTLSDVIRGIKAGACDYIFKPSSHSELLNAVRRALVLENTVNLRVSDSAPIIKDLMARAEKLNHENKEAKKIVQDLSKKDVLKKWVVRLLSLVSSVAATTVLYRIQVLTNPLLISPMLIIFFILFFLPIERIKEIKAKFLGTEAHLKMSSDKKPTSSIDSAIARGRDFSIDRRTAVQIRHKLLLHLSIIRYTSLKLIKEPEKVKDLVAVIEENVGHASRILEEFAKRSQI